MSQTPTTLLSVDHLSVAYGAIRALRDVSLRIQAGEIVTLIGSNGAGKTTLLRTISGLLRPTDGTIRCNGDDLHTLAPHRIVRKGICHVPEGRQIFANLSVRENLILGAYSLPHDKAAQKSAMERVYEFFPILAERRHQNAGTLSGGEQQMLAIGRALMGKPKLLLLDEPSLGLAPLIVRKIFQIIREINAQGTTIFLVEQNAHMALITAHRGYVLQSGEVQLSGSAAQLLDDPQVKQAYLGG
ncbi:MAG: ABC transporter ATP-binding protein [Phycisphaerales bacterium]|jgi:branched-chain amino acid transport system ATP-binding protein|nr:ABC transporter ATP-binding protein [Phycisphaerales bacterium]